MTDALERRLLDLFPAERIGRWRTAERDLPLVSPDSEEGWRECLRLAHAGGHRIHPVGAGTKLSWCPPPPGTELVLSSAAWEGVVAYEPGDGTLTARSGSTMDGLAKTVAGGGHLLSPDVALASRATLGGVIAAGQSGFDRLLHGSIRDALLGTRVLLADGRSSKSGGRLVKNVTGYDLHRLWCGSRGSLCVVLEASLRLYPAPRERRMLAAEAETIEQAFALAAHLWREGRDIRPAAVCVHDEGRGREPGVLLALQGRAEVVASEEASIRRLLPRIRVSTIEGEEQWKRLRDRPALLPSLEIQTLPMGTGLAVARAREAAAPFVVTAHPLVGTASLSFEEEVDLREQAQGIAALAPPGTRVLLRGASSGGPLGTDVPPAARALMERLKLGYDPTGVFAGGVPA